MGNLERNPVILSEAKNLRGTQDPRFAQDDQG